MLLPLVAALVIISSSCGNKASSSDPKAVLQEFFERMAKKDIDGAAKLTTKDSKSTMEMMKKGMDAAEKSGVGKDEDPTKDFSDVEYGDAKINGIELELQGYITRCYGSLTTFNFLFRDEEDKFRGTGE